jgi:hypothetical protein
MPNNNMRHFIFSTTILILAINGIACACPSENSVGDHSSHQMHGEASSDNRPDCCDKCDDTTAANKHGKLTHSAPKKSSHYDSDASTQYAFEIFWDENSAAKRSFVDRNKPVPPSTPIMLYDRMLD